MRDRDNSLSPETEKALDSALGPWIARHGLSAARAEAIRRQVLLEAGQEQAELSHEWWKRFANEMTAALWQWVDTRRYLNAPFSPVQSLR